MPTVSSLGREIRHHRGPCQRMGAAGRDGPTDPHTPRRPAQRRASAYRQTTGSCQSAFPARPAQCTWLTHTGDEVALLVKFAIVGQVHFRHKAQQFTVAEYCRAVVELAVVAYRQPDEDNKVQSFAGFQNRGKAVLGPAQEPFPARTGRCRCSRSAQTPAGRAADVFLGVFAHDADDLGGVVEQSATRGRGWLRRRG